MRPVVEREPCEPAHDSPCMLLYLLRSCERIEDLQILTNVRRGTGGPSLTAQTWPAGTHVPDLVFWSLIHMPPPPLRSMTIVSERGMATTSAYLLITMLGRASMLRELFLYGISIPELDHDHPPEEGGCQLEVLEFEACSFSADALRGLAPHCREVSVVAITGCEWATQSTLLSLLPPDRPTKSLEMGGASRAGRSH